MALRTSGPPSAQSSLSVISSILMIQLSHKFITHKKFMATLLIDDICTLSLCMFSLSLTKRFLFLFYFCYKTFWLFAVVVSSYHSNKLIYVYIIGSMFVCIFAALFLYFFYFYFDIFSFCYINTWYAFLTFSL